MSQATHLHEDHAGCPCSPTIILRRCVHGQPAQVMAHRTFGEPTMEQRRERSRSVMQAIYEAENECAPGCGVST